MQRALKTTKNRQRLGYRRIASLLVFLVVVPTLLILAIGIVSMSLGQTFNLIFGILTVSFVALMVTGVVLVFVFLRREANLSELQSDFVSKVSHELRTPLTGIRLLSETLQRSRGKADVEAKCIDAIESETDRLTSLIERLLDWGRMEAGRKQFDLQETSVAEIVNDAALAFAGRPFADGAFTWHVEDDLPPVFADSYAILDVISNLLSNAHKYGGSPPVIELSAKAHPKGVAIEVRDNGAGIPRLEHRRIFDKFYRIDDRLSRAREGSGLGLAIVKHIVRAHHGRIQVDSETGVGSTFRIVLPAYKGPSSTRAKQPSAGAPSIDGAHDAAPPHAPDPRPL